ncbi:MAG: PilN domain-containing protein [Planctomycetota bacterium]|nr:PilN domain-containing protein [Planctomycetota bacterium]
MNQTPRIATTSEGGATQGAPASGPQTLDSRRPSRTTSLRRVLVLSPAHPSPQTECEFVCMEGDRDRRRLVEVGVVGASVSAIRDLRKRLGAIETLVVAPPEGCLIRARTVPAPVTPESLGLLSEGLLPPDVATYRRAAGVVDHPGGSTAILTAWHSGATWPWLAELNPEPMLVAPGACLVGLLHLAGLSTPAAVACLWRPNTPRASDAPPPTLLAAGLTTNFATRSIRLDLDEPDALAGAIRDVGGDLGNTLASELSAVTANLTRSGVVMDAQARGRLATRMEGWDQHAASAGGPASLLSKHALGLGAAALSLGPASLRSLCSLEHRSADERAGALERASAWLGVRKNAVRVAAAALSLAIVALFLAPLARLAALEPKAAALAAGEQARAEAVRRAALYKQLERDRWPMTKLMSDVSAAAPEGITLDFLRLSPEQGLALAGSARDDAVLAGFQTNLNKTGLFDNVKIDRSETSSSGVEFDLSARVASPHLFVKPIDDFAARPLVVRLYGEAAAVASPTSVRADEDEAGDADGDESESDPSQLSGASSAASSSNETAASTPTRTSAPSSGGTLAPLTDEQISAMDAGTATREWGARRRASRASGIDPAERARLESEVEKLNARMKAARSAPPGGSP